MHVSSAYYALAAIAALSSTVLAAPGDAATPCTLSVPADPLSAKGLSTPYVLGAGCTMADAGTQSFVEATILDPATGQLYVYNPLVITSGTQPAVAPVVPKLPANAIVGIWFGSNANTIVLTDTNGSLKQGSCVNGLKDSPFGQFAACNGAALMQAALTKAKIPALGKAADGTVCPTTRSFAVVDQDQSDNVNTQYLLVGTQTAQDTAANTKKFGKKASVVNNGSDNALLTAFLDPAIGCTPFLVPSLDDPGVMRATLATDELQATLQAAPVALIPATDPMVLVDGTTQSLEKTNAYRNQVGQVPAARLSDADGKTYCQNFLTVGPPTIQSQKSMTVKGATPDPATGNNLFTFLGARFAASYVNLNCSGLLGVESPVVPVLDKNGVAIDITFLSATTSTAQTATAAPVYHTRTKSSTFATATAAAPRYHTRTKASPPAATTTSTGKRCKPTKKHY
ncbi:hypothetical protein HKX48_008659 [Thoreauomyces humboldtii]|nr:hypothetical protein HKX48_008659 [Thoreauomyces humboldtii]